MRNAAPAPPLTTTESDERAYLYMVAGAFAFATMGALSHLAGEKCDWRIVATARALIMFAISLSLALSSGVRVVALRAPAILWMRSFAGSFGMLCAFYALTHLPISTAITLSNTVPVWVTLLAWPALGQKPSSKIWLAIAIGLVGIILIQRPEVPGYKLAGMLAIGNALFTACSMIGLNRLRGVDARAVVTHFSGVSTAFMIVTLLLAGPAIDYGVLASGATLAVLAGVGASGTLGQLAMTKAFALGAPSRVSVVGLTQVIFAITYDVIIWHRSFDTMTIAGILLVTAPSAWLMLHIPFKKTTPIHTTT
jgi:drug/metabolite transporter (DMT)-like permease